MDRVSVLGRLFSSNENLLVRLLCVGVGVRRWSLVYFSCLLVDELFCCGDFNVVVGLSCYGMGAMFGCQLLCLVCLVNTFVHQSAARQVV